MRILVIEDHKDILDNITDYCTLRGYEVVGALDGLTGLHLAVTGKFDAIILDVMLPGMNGNLLCKSLRENSKDQIPILMLTAGDELSDRLSGFEAGADDYIVKPFALSELFARTEAVVRRARGAKNRVLQVHDLTCDLDSLEVSRGGKILKLNRTNRLFLELLMRKSPSIVKRRELEEAVWGRTPPDSDSLRSNIYLLRQVLDKPFDVPLLHTHHGVGYRLHGPR
ncbi:response regulator transcription factor [Pseudomonas bohemica]|uniref:response regulator transcription factor n=1 Tax=Pseudomonas bohemica TaxID=2044872 RepID=UPI000DA612D1|nr:response regulator transcription factor [Pseudomonas bohemica]